MNLQVIQPINGDPFIGMLEVDTLWLITSCLVIEEYLSCALLSHCDRQNVCQRLAAVERDDAARQNVLKLPVTVRRHP